MPHLEITKSNPSRRRFQPRVEELEDRCVPATAFGVVGTASLIRFDTATPGTIAATLNVTGLQSGETLAAIDFRPATGQLFGLGSTSRLYTINLSSGAATVVGTAPFTPALTGTQTDIDFNPTVDRVRLDGNTGQDLRLNPNTGSTASTDPALAYATGDVNFGVTPSVSGIAYTNSFRNPGSTVLYGIDSNTGALVIQNPPNNGTLNTVGSLGVTTSSAVGFDIIPGSNTAYATLTVSGVSGLYTINLTTGRATLVGNVGGGSVVRGLAVLGDGIYVTGAGPGGGPQVNVYDAATGVLRASFFAFASSFTGGVTVAIGDVNRDGVDDIIVGAGPGGGPQVRVFDGQTFQPLAGPLGSFYAFNPSFTGGVFVAPGDVDGDGFTDVIVGAGAGGGPQVAVFSGQTGAQLASFFAFSPSFTGGVRVAGGAITNTFNTAGNQLLSDIVCAAGPGGGPQVSIFSGTTFTQVSSFNAFAASFTGGVFVSVGDLNFDGRDDIIAGAGAGGGPQVTTFNGVNFTQLSSFFALPPSFTGGVRVGYGRNFGGTGRPYILTSAGPGGGPQVSSYDSSTLATLLGSFFAYPQSFTGGVYVR